MGGTQRKRGIILFPPIQSMVQVVGSGNTVANSQQGLSQPKIKFPGIKFLCRSDFSGGGGIDAAFKPLICFKMVVMEKKSTEN